MNCRGVSQRKMCILHCDSQHDVEAHLTVYGREQAHVVYYILYINSVAFPSGILRLLPKTEPFFHMVSTFISPLELSENVHQQIRGR